MSNPYRESAFAFVEQAPELALPELCLCGHSPEHHHFFNSELVGCNALGQYDKTPASKVVNASAEERKAGFVKHYPNAVCGCEHYVDWHPPLAFRRDEAQLGKDYILPLRHPPR